MSDEKILRPGRLEYDGYYKYDHSVAESYDRDREVEGHWWIEDSFIEAFFKNYSPSAVLDVPVGTGRFLHHYAGVHRVVGVDVSDDMLAQARRRLLTVSHAGAWVLEKGDVFALRFADGEFDAVVVWRLLHLIPERLLAQAIAEVTRLCSGRVIVQTYALPPRTAPVRRVLWQRVVSRLQRQLFWQRSFRPDVAITKPWSHIRAYYHHQWQVDALFDRHGFKPAEVTLLDQYDGCDVRATVYQV